LNLKAYLVKVSRIVIAKRSVRMQMTITSDTYGVYRLAMPRN
jgi:hypothetical protein